VFFALFDINLLDESIYSFLAHGAYIVVCHCGQFLNYWCRYTHWTS